MESSTKILLGAAATTLLGWATYSATCNADAAAASTPTTATTETTPAAVVPATQEAVAACQEDINTLMTDKSINFQSGSAYIANDSNALLDQVASALKPCTGTAVEIQGHTDLIGGAEINQALSQSRADTVKKALVDRGIPDGQLTAKGYGASQPIENARTAEANAKNRRTIFAVSAAGAAPTAPTGG